MMSSGMRVYVLGNVLPPLCLPLKNALRVRVPRTVLVLGAQHDGRAVVAHDRLDDRQLWPLHDGRGLDDLFCCL